MLGVILLTLLIVIIAVVEYLLFTKKRQLTSMISSVENLDTNLHMLRWFSSLSNSKNENLESILQNIAKSLVSNKEFSLVSIRLTEDAGISLGKVFALEKSKDHSKKIFVYRNPLELANISNLTNLEKFLVSNSGDTPASGETSVHVHDLDNFSEPNLKSPQAMFQSAVVASLKNYGNIIMFSVSKRPLTEDMQQLIDTIANTIIFFVDKNNLMKNMPKSDQLKAVGTKW
jgi:hypothetical protein